VLEREAHVWLGELDRPESRQALRRVLGAYLEEDPAAIELRRGPHGKPALADPTATLRFNLSHSGGLALIAVVDGREVGVDVERERPRRNLLRLAERALDPVEAAAVRAAAPADRLTLFHQAWARREAAAKCHGAGLRAPPPDTPVAVADLDVGPGFAAAIAVAGEAVAPLKLLPLGAEPRNPSDRHLARAPR
jgi:4'-phosphopantetheinyl transferase